MKISFSSTTKDRRTPYQEFTRNFRFSSKSQLVSIEIYGTHENPKVNFIASGGSSIPESRPLLAIMTLYWSQAKTLQVKYYSHTGLNCFIGKEKLNHSNTINGESTLKIGNLSILLIIEANQVDLDNCELSYKEFLEICARRSIRMSNLKLSNITGLDGIDLLQAKLYNISFQNVSLKGAIFSRCLLNEVVFENVDLSGSDFDGCRSVYDRYKIENEKALIFRNIDNFSNVKMRNSVLFAFFENVILDEVDFSNSKFFASRFSDCILKAVNFRKSRLMPYEVSNSKPGQKRTPYNVEVIAVTSITSSLYRNYEGKSCDNTQNRKITIEKCNFKSVSAKCLDLSNNHIVDTRFEDSVLLQTKICNSYCEKVLFSIPSSIATDLRKSDLSNSRFVECDFSGANMKEVKMISSSLEKTYFIDTMLYGSNLMMSSFKGSDLTNSDLRTANLTKVTFHKSNLNLSKFFKTQRGGLNLNISVTDLDSSEIDENSNKKTKTYESNGNSNKKTKTYESNCTIGCIDWSPQGDGETQIDEESFLSIIMGHQSPITVLSKSSDASSKIYLQAYNQVTTQAVAKNAAEDFNDASVTNTGDIFDSNIEPGNISKTDINGVDEANLEENIIEDDRVDEENSSLEDDYDS